MAQRRATTRPRINLAGLFSLALTAMLLAGCSYPPGEVTPDPVSRTEYPQISTFGQLSGNLSFTEPSVDYDKAADQPLSVSVPIRLRDNKAREAQYRFIFFKPSGEPVEPQMDWRYVKLPSRRQIFLKGTATTLEARDWRLEIRPFQ